VGFNGVPKYIKASVFLSDMTLHLSEIRAKSIISVHSIVNAADSNLNDFCNALDILSSIRQMCSLLFPIKNRATTVNITIFLNMLLNMGILE
jgi:hypothetical protein